MKNREGAFSFLLIVYFKLFHRGEKIGWMRFTFEQIILFYFILEVIFKYYNRHIYLSNVVIQRLIKQKFSQKLSLSLDFDDLTMIRKLSVRNVIS